MEKSQSTSTNAAAVGSSPRPGTQAPAAYFKTLPGILKAVSVLTGLFAMSLTAYAYNNARWFTTIPLRACPYCPPVSYVNLEETCQTHGPGNKSCPTSWLVMPPLLIIAFAWVGTLIVLIVLLFVDLTKKPTFSTVDMIGHFVAGVLAIISALCLLGYCISVWNYGACEGSAGRRGRTFQENLSNTTATGRQYYPGDRDLTCAQTEALYFKQWHIFFGALFAGATGVLYVVIGVMTLKSRKGQQVRPMMGQFGAPMQTQSASYQPQGYGFTPQQSSTQAPQKT